MKKAEKTSRVSPVTRSALSVDIGARSCDERLLSAIYFLFLRRDAEEGCAWLGHQVSDVVSALISSDEFGKLARRVLSEGVDEFEHDEDDRANARYLALLDEFGVARSRSSYWPDCLASALRWVEGSPFFAPMPPPARDLIKFIDENFDPTIDQRECLAHYLKFDHEWFVRACKLTPALTSLKKQELEAIAPMMIIKGEADFSPFFPTSGPHNVSLRQQVFGSQVRFATPTMDSVEKSIGAAVEKGILTHWLFCPAYYESSRSIAFDAGHVQPWRPLQNPYLDFLNYGSRNRIRPHWLFCPSACDELNGGSKPDGNLFDYYVRYGQYIEFRTSALFDPVFYDAMNSSARLDLSNGGYGSFTEHFLRVGIFNNAAFLADFDLEFYCSNYPDVAPDGIHVLSIAHHFLKFGHREFRNPNPFFDAGYLASRYPWIGEECREKDISLIEHFLLFGRHKKMRASRPLGERGVDILQAKGLYERRALRDLAKQLRAPIDFTPVVDDDPIVSVIVPVHNQASFTARFLTLAYFGAAEIKRRLGRSLELIVVSNGSHDETDGLLGATKGIKLLIEPEALGYPKAANLGVSIASAELVVIVNNDIEFEPSVFADMVESYQSQPGCGAIGPQILSMDSTIQEIGAYIAGDGSTFGFGRGDPAISHRTNNVHDVDYVSGCFLCVSREDFSSLGGFDIAFSPGYYEEVDLCLRLREAGFRILVDPRIEIVHYEHASFTKGRPPSVSYPTILRNRKALLKKHPGITTRPTADKLQGSAGLSSWNGSQSRVLVIEDLVPDHRLGSGFGRAAEVLRSFYRLGVEFDVLAMNPAREVDDYEFLDVRLFRNWMPSESIDHILGNLGHHYSHIWVCRTHNLSRLYPLLKAHKERWRSVIVCDTEAVSIQRSVELARCRGKEFTSSEIDALVAAEFNGAAIVDRFIAVNQRDKELIGRIGLENVSIISHTASGVSRSERPREERQGLLFVGSIHAPTAPNYDSLKWVQSEIGTLLDKFDLTLTVVGYWDKAILREFRRHAPSKRIRIEGAVSEARLSELYGQSIAALAPTRFSAGIPCKVVEAMLTGTPIVMTALLADQIGASGTVRSRLAISELDPRATTFRQTVERLLTESDWWASVRKAQLDFAEKRYGAHSFDAEVRAALADARVLVEPGG